MKKKLGRPIIEIDWEVFENLCKLQCTLIEIASYFECSEDTIEKACKRQYDKLFTDVFKEKRGKGKIALRRKQYSIALDGDKTMLIWLGKQYLNQAEKQEVSGPRGGPITVIGTGYPKEK